MLPVPLFQVVLSHGFPDSLRFAYLTLPFFLEVSLFTFEIREDEVAFFPFLSQ